MGEFFWIKPPREGEFEVNLGARLLTRDARRVKVLDDEGHEHWIPLADMLGPMHSSSIKGVDDMIVLGDLQEHAILRNLLLRYEKDLIYTYTGTMLIAVNPYKVLPIYNKREMNLYREKKIGELPPHIFAVGDNSFESMRSTAQRQCVVISGESGAGKTESTKLILQYVAALSKEHAWIQQQILDSNPILEAFGNAKTVRNDNSSRFGKYIALQFTEDGSITGAEIKQYLLEKSRLVFQNRGERNYHIFYSMLAGLPSEERNKLGLKDAAQYTYLNGGNALTCDDRNEAAEFAGIQAAMKVLNFNNDELKRIYELLAAMLHIGNLQFKAVTVANMDGSEVIDKANLERIALLLGTNCQNLSNALTKKTIAAQGDKVTTILSTKHAMDSKDAYVKAIYGNLFIYIVNKINVVIKPKLPPTDRYIGVLDIFGFENFENNSFEQLCINLANENLQQFFIHHIFKLEQEEYTNEGVDWKRISFIDNQAILDMIAVRPMNILSLIDEEAKFPKGTDETMLEKIVTEHVKKSEFFRPKFKGISAFGINHFAGAVFYNVQDFLEKDRDSFSVDLRLLAENSSNPFLRFLFPKESVQTGGGKKKDTLALKFRESLDHLMKELGQCQPYFIRCIKPNELKKPRIFDRPLCTRQLRYSGLMETAKIRQAGYPIRYSFEEFVQRFRVLGRGIPLAHRVNCRETTAAICERVFGGVGDFQLGHTKIFLKTPEDVKLDLLRSKTLAKYVVVLQTHIRGWIMRRRFQRLRKAAIVIQSHWRARGPRLHYNKMARGYRRLQARLRSRVLTYRYNALRRRMIGLQAYCKGFVIRQWVRQKIQEKKGKMREAMVVRKKEEEEFRRAGRKDWRDAAAANWRRKLAELNIVIREEEIALIEQPPLAEEDEEEQTKLLENIFGFLDEETEGAGNVSDKESKRGKDYIGLHNVDKDTQDYSEYNFRKFAATYFRGNVTGHYYRRRLRHALLDQTPPGLDAAARALWITILRFMGDMAEPRYGQESEKSHAPVMNQIAQTLSRKFVKSAAYREALASEEEKARRRKLISMTLKRSDKIGPEVRRAMLEEDAEEAYTPWLNTRSTSMEKIHFIIGHGILKPELRDEIFAQVCKQLTNNPVRSSFGRGWQLLRLCIGCFPPSEILLNTLRSFMQSGHVYSNEFLHRLSRTIQNGVRSQPPSFVETGAIFRNRSIDIKVELLDGSSKTLEVDSATTARELIKALAGNVEIADTYGFSLYVSLYDKLSSLGDGREHVMDAISQCEQYAREQGHKEISAPWRMHLKFERFAPWFNESADPVTTKLIYHQVMRGIKSGEYRCEKERDLALLMAQQYYIEYGLLDARKLKHSLSQNMPEHILRTLGDDQFLHWEKIVQDSYTKNLQGKTRIEKVREQIVNFAKNSWSLFFSRYFEVMELSDQSPLPKRQPVVLALNSEGIFFVDQNEQTLAKVAFMETQSVSYNGESPLKLSTIDGTAMLLHGTTLSELNEVLDDLLKQLKKRSKYAVVTKDYRPDSGSTFMGLMKGDLIELAQNGESLEMNSWGEGRNERSGETGNFPKENVTVVPSAVKPTPAAINMIKEGSNSVAKGPGFGTLKRMRLYSLEKYAAKHFRMAARRSTISRGTSLTAIKQNQTEELWRHSREPLKRPLLQRLQNDEALSATAYNAFISILKYMGDLPTRSKRVGTEYTDKIFEGALKHEALRDEIYCQIMKQLTVNRTKYSEDRGWELLWLVTGLFPCSAELERELVKFLESRRQWALANDCLLRFRRILSSGVRRFPPHQIEIDAIQHKHSQIYHRVFFPNDSDEAFVLESTTRASDLIMEIGRRLQLKSCEGFSLFIKVSNKILSIPEADYFFDFVRSIMEWLKKTMPGGDSTPLFQYQIYCMRKLWVSSSVGRDRNADLIFHFPQELPKYLRGYHKVSTTDAVKLAAFLYISQFGQKKIDPKNEKQFEPMIPSHVYKLQKPKEWITSIRSIVNSHVGLSEDDAKLEFLKAICEWPTFGSAFFEVKQTTEPSYPEVVLVAINRKGVHIIHPATKDVMVVHDYINISNWSSGNTYFSMNIGAMIRGGGTRLNMETLLGYKMDDLLRSYANLLQTTSARRKSLRSTGQEDGLSMAGTLRRKSAKAPAPPPPNST